jgi:hypothetical protein
MVVFEGGQASGVFRQKGGQLSKVLPLPAMPYPSMPCGRASPIDDNDFNSTNYKERKNDTNCILTER